MDGWMDFSLSIAWLLSEADCSFLFSICLAGCNLMFSLETQHVLPVPCRPGVTADQGGINCTCKLQSLNHRRTLYPCVLCLCVLELGSCAGPAQRSAGRCLSHHPLHAQIVFNEKARWRARSRNQVNLLHRLGYPPAVHIRVTTDFGAL